MVLYRDAIKSTGDTKWMALQMWCSGMMDDGCEHLSIAWPRIAQTTLGRLVDNLLATANN